MNKIEERDIFDHMETALKSLGARGFAVHRGALYEDIDLAGITAALGTGLNAPQKHSKYGGERALRERIAARFLGSERSSNEIVLCIGATNGLSLACSELRGGERSVLHVLSPYWLYLEGVVRCAGARMDQIRTLENGRLRSEAELLERIVDALSERSCGIYLATPANPVGNRFGSTFVESLVRLCEQRQLSLIVDHAYYGFDKYEARQAALEPLPACFRHPRVLNVFRFSKLYGIPGLRPGLVQSCVDVAERLNDRYRYTNFTPKSFSQSIVHHLLEHDALLQRRKRQYAENLQIAADLLSEFFVVPQDGFFAFPKVTEVEAERLLAQGIGVVPGRLFGTGYDEHVRFCFASESPGV